MKSFAFCLDGTFFIVTWAYFELRKWFKATKQIAECVSQWRISLSKKHLKYFSFRFYYFGLRHEQWTLFNKNFIMFVIIKISLLLTIVNRLKFQFFYWIGRNLFKSIDFKERISIWEKVLRRMLILTNDSCCFAIFCLQKLVWSHRLKGQITFTSLEQIILSSGGLFRFGEFAILHQLVDIIWVLKALLKPNKLVRFMVDIF